MGNAIRIYLGMDAKVPLKVGVRIANQLKINHSLFIILVPKIKRIIANKVAKSSKRALKRGKPEVVAAIFK